MLEAKSWTSLVCVDIHELDLLLLISFDHYLLLYEGDMGICRVAVLIFFYCGDAVNKISICGVAVISNPSVCDVCVFHAAVFGEMKLFAVL